MATRTNRAASYMSQTIHTFSGFSNKVLIAGLLYFKEIPDEEKIRSVIKEKIFTVSRMCSTITEEGFADHVFHVVEEKEMKVENHFQVIDETVTHDTVDAMATKYWNEDITVNCPPWKLLLFKSCNFDSEHKAMVMFVCDHALTDGTTAIALLMSCLEGAESKKTDHIRKARPKPHLPPLLQARAFIAGARQGLFGPLLPADKGNLLKCKDHRNPGLTKSIANTPNLDLNKIKALKNMYPGATVTDVLLAVLTVSLRRYFASKGAVPASVRANFPMDMRPKGIDLLKNAMGNRFASGVFEFPLGYTNSNQVIWEIVERTQLIKCSPAPLIEKAMLGNLVPILVKNGSGGRRQLANLILDTYGKVTMMLSSNMGPQNEVKFAGQPIDDLRFYAFAPLGAYTGIISYNNKVSCGIVLDGECGDAKEVASHWEPAFDELMTAAEPFEHTVPKYPINRPISPYAGFFFGLFLASLTYSWFLAFFFLFLALLAWA